MQEVSGATASGWDAPALGVQAAWPQCLKGCLLATCLVTGREDWLGLDGQFREGGARGYRGHLQVPRQDIPLRVASDHPCLSQAPSRVGCGQS